MKVYLVKFAPFGYYAAKQPNYTWSYTEDPAKAAIFKTYRAANCRGIYGTQLINAAAVSYEVESWEQTITLTKAN